MSSVRWNETAAMLHACLEESQYVKRMLLIAIIPVRCSQILKCSAFKFSDRVQDSLSVLL